MGLNDLTPADAGGAFLFSEEVLAAITEQERDGIFTSERFERLHPERHAACLELLASGQVSQATIAKTLKCHHRTVAAVSLRHPEKIDAFRSKLAGKLRLLAMQQIERVIDDPDMIPKNVVGLVISQALTTAELLSGGVTARIEQVTVRKPTPDDLNAMIDALPSLNTGIETGKTPPIAAGARVPGALAERTIETVSEVIRDSQSLDCLGEVDSDTRQDTRKVPQPTPRHLPEQGGGGGRETPPPAESSNG